MGKSFKNVNFCTIMHTQRNGEHWFPDFLWHCWWKLSLQETGYMPAIREPNMILHLHLSRALTKVSWAPGTTNSCKNIWQNSTIATGILVISVTFNHITCQRKKNHAWKCQHSFYLKMVSCCVQFSTAIVITAKGFLSTLLRFCSHSCPMSLQDNLKIKNPTLTKNTTQRIRKVTHFILLSSQSWFWHISFVSLLSHVFLSLNEYLKITKKHKFWWKKL